MAGVDNCDLLYRSEKARLFPSKKKLTTSKSSDLTHHSSHGQPLDSKLTAYRKIPHHRKPIELTHNNNYLIDLDAPNLHICGSAVGKSITIPNDMCTQREKVFPADTNRIEPVDESGSSSMTSPNNVNEDNSSSTTSIFLAGSAITLISVPIEIHKEFGPHRGQQEWV